MFLKNEIRESANRPQGNGRLAETWPILGMNNENRPVQHGRLVQELADFWPIAPKVADHLLINIKIGNADDQLHC